MSWKESFQGVSSNLDQVDEDDRVRTEQCFPTSFLARPLTWDYDLFANQQENNYDIQL